MASGDYIMFAAANKAIIDAWLSGKSFRAALVTSSWTPAQTTDDTWSDMSANEVANGNGYTTHGISVTLSSSQSTLVVTVDDAANPSWTASGGSIVAKYLVVVVDADANGALASTDPVVAYVDLNTSGGSVTVADGGTLTLTTGSGVFTSTAAAAA